MSTIFDQFFNSSPLSIPETNWEDCEYEDEIIGLITKEMLGEIVFETPPIILDLYDSDRISVSSERASPINLSSEENILFEHGLREQGIDCLAFYKSKRLLNSEPFKNYWGIFYLEKGIAFVKNKIIEFFNGHPPKIENLEADATMLLRQHEHYHFRADMQIKFFELILQKQLYEPFHNRLNKHALKKFFVEEALANRDLVNWAKKNKLGKFALNFCDLQPHAYSRFYENEKKLKGEWLSNILGCNPPASKPLLGISNWADVLPKYFYRKMLCPEYLVNPIKLSEFIDPAWAPPKVNVIVDSAKVKKVLNKKYKWLNEQWNQTKNKLILNPYLPGLGFKPWPKENKNGQKAYSVKLTDGFRAHLLHEGAGKFLAYSIGNHKEMGHG